MLPQPSFMSSLHAPPVWEVNLRLSESSSEDAATLSSESFQMDDGDARQAATTSHKRSKRGTPSSDKKRKTTYDIRREQKVELTAQVETLQKQLDDLKFRVLVEHGEAAKSNKRAAAGNAVLYEFIQQQHLELAKMQAMLAGHLQLNVDLLHPAQSIIRLGTDPIERHNVLVALKDKKLQEAKQFITTRSQGLDPRSSYCQEERNNGDSFCQVIFEIRPIIGAGAREVFDAFVDVSQNAEIIISEMFGSITIRENNEADTRDISQMRLVTSTSQGTLVEANTVMFAEFVEANDESCGVIVSDFVDSDELYPYKPEQRVRRDTTTVFVIRSFKAKAKDLDDEEVLVVASRWTCSKIRRSEMDLSADILREMEESTVSFGDTMKKCIQQRLARIIFLRHT
ncbi:uncharacterized protein PITG_07132 [Phytophthora infestans T30-4]|uniref:Uncharacterized protein n=1 Tax=Phytophthora infestans (strain T30-4) TaxID=403677 RepID=D0N7C6_PHYIT|nr:uncharacterized protein PITG_07132 [Phytophthora infestans T30-4]EEY53475.1 conserved hypothetical protein [Phytophthora infestans T30-4]|eukprot:XP_002905093.1 conserved hypothetical protein [Phytophthora infestans T30-4]